MSETEMREMELRELSKGCNIKKIRGRNENEADIKFYKFTDKYDIDVSFVAVRKINKNKVVYKIYYS